MLQQQTHLRYLELRQEMQTHAKINMLSLSEGFALQQVCS